MLNRRSMILRPPIVATLIFAVLATSAAVHADELRTEAVVVIHDPVRRGIAEAVAEAWPRLLSDANRKLGLEYGRQATCYVENGHRGFNARIRSLGGEDHPDHVSAVAFSFRDTVVLKADAWRTGRATRNKILQHEIVHLILGHFVLAHPKTHLPRWLDEGLAQWVTDAVFIREVGGLLNQAARRDELLNFDDLEDAFPSGERASGLAYAQSLSLVRFIDRFGDPDGGRDNIRALIRGLRRGQRVEEALQIITGLPEERLLTVWRDGLVRESGLTIRNLGAFLFSGFILIVMTVMFMASRARRAARLEAMGDDDPARPFEPDVDRQ